ncbi:MAG: cyclic nucleotide-binding domain-containing protein [Sandaracinaceae bacterium]|nr:cyclic nucleotide-binding domain-containing protein [Sandaracinaceae bacterium]
MATEFDSLDDAWTAWLDGQSEAALRACVSILEADGSQDAAASLLALALADTHEEARERASELVDVFIDRGDLPRAVVMAKVARDGLDRVAEAFAVGSDRVAAVPPMPPPLPPASLRPVTDSGDALVSRGLKALRERPRSSDRQSVPQLPLFGALGPADLEALLEAFEVRDVRTGEVVVAEGGEGTEAYIVVRGMLQAVRGEGDSATVLAELGPGSIFGEMALVSGAPRAASVIATEPVQLLVGPVKRLEELSSRAPNLGRELSEFCRARMVANLMRHSRILAAVDADRRESLIDRFETVTFDAGDVLVERDAPASGLLLIASGHVRVLGVDADGDELVVAELGPGDVVGEIGLVLRRPATADVVATHRTVALRLTAAEFQDAIREHPTLLGELYELAAKRDEEMRTVVAQETLDVEDIVLL